MSTNNCCSTHSRDAFRRRGSMVVVFVAAWLSGCATTSVVSTSACPLPQRPGVTQTLYFGADRPTGGTVSDADWSQFLATVVTPRFPQGLTWWRADGQWRGDNGAIVHEASRVLRLLGEDSPAFEADVSAVAKAYKSAYQQEGVLRVRNTSCLVLE